jgi:hypothetical protein
MTSISVYTFTLGREFYLNRLINSIIETGDSEKIDEQYIIFQGCKASQSFLNSIPKNINIIEWEENVGAGEGNNRILKKLSGNLIIKLDDDALIHSKRYFTHAEEIDSILNCPFSPYPVGLINNPGGVPSKEHFVNYGEKTDTYYTFRKVSHIGGFARICQKSIVDKITWKYDYSLTNSGHEDIFFSSFCNTHNIPMYYLENAMVVEHQESTLGQHERYKNYFKNGRF